MADFLHQAVDYLTGKGPDKQYPPHSSPPRMPNPNNYAGPSGKTYIGPDFPPEASPRGSWEGSQSMSPNKDYP